MYCLNCGKEIENTSKFCKFCGTEIISKEITSNQDNNKEIIIKEGLCNRVKSKLLVQNGHGMLTNKRFIYSKHSLAKIAAMGVLVNLTKGTYDFEIPISEISQIKEGKQGFSKTIIICTKSGEEYNFYFTNKIAWEIEFSNLIKQ